MNKKLIKSTILLATLAFASNSLAATQILNVFINKSFDAYGPAKQLKELFEQDCECSIKYHILPSQSAVLNQLKLNTIKNADVILGFDSIDINNNEYDKYFRPLEFNLPELVIPWQNQSTYYVPYDWSPITLLTTDPNIPDNISLQAFLDNKSTVIYTDPRTHALGKYLLRNFDYVFNNENDLRIAFTKLKNKTITVGKSWSETWGAFIKGESDTYWGYASSIIYNRIHGKNEEEKNSVRALSLQEGVYASAQVGAIPKNSTNVKLANRFLQFLVKSEAQQLMVELDSGYPVIELKLPVLENLPKFKILPNQNKNYAKPLDTWIKANS